MLPNEVVTESDLTLNVRKTIAQLLVTGIVFTVDDLAPLELAGG